MRFPILIPAYNAAATIYETLESIAQQSPSALALIDRVIVADDGSIDATKDVVSRFADSSSLPIEIWDGKQNSGERTVVNRSFKRLLDEGYDWCMVLHADDVAKPYWIETIADRIRIGLAATVVSICSSWDDWFPEVVHPGEDDWTKPDVVCEGGVAAACGTLASGCWWHFSGCAMNLKLFFQVGAFYEDMPQLGDLEWVIRSQLHGSQILYIPRTLFKYRHTQANVSSTSFRTNRDLKEAILIFVRHQGTDGLDYALERYAQTNLRISVRRIAVSIVRGNFSRGVSAASYAAKLSKYLSVAQVVTAVLQIKT